MFRPLSGLLRALPLLLCVAANAQLEHPDFPALDAQGETLEQWDSRVSETTSCGSCHDTDYITRTLDPAHRLVPEQLQYLSVELHRVGVAPLAEGDQVSCLGCHGTGIPRVDDGMADGRIVARSSNSSGCSACHGAIVLRSEPPFAHDGQRRAADLSYRSGALFVAQRISASGMNIADKDGRRDPFDIHLARGMLCSDCHRGLNRPGDTVQGLHAELPHLHNDPRGVPIGEYLDRPDHGMGRTMQCTDCHRSASGHDWLPFPERHMARIACESCHIPNPLGPALRRQDLADATRELRGRDARGLISGYQPILLPREGRLSPFNLIATWYDDAGQRKGQLQAVPLNHGVVKAAALKDCATCHQPGGRAQSSLAVGTPAPGAGELAVPPLLRAALHLERSPGTEAPMLTATAVPEAGGFYLLGADQVSWADRLGMLITLATLVGVVVHGGARYLLRRRRGTPPAEHQRIYMYTVYERFWHWLQAAAILVLLVTGAAIHKPYLFGFLSFPYMVHLHNTVGFVLLGNALLAAFYHLASGEVKQYLPGRADLFARMFTQAAYYTGGIFRGEPHPFARDAEHKLNPLQQITYLGLLNTLLPAQILTGLLIWGAQRWPQISDGLGGLMVLAPLHSFMAWLFAAFLIMHIYLTTTAGPGPLSAIRAMLEGWEDVETPHGGPS
jgi:thiosulfate reductase cytochrome b subunit